MAFSERIRNKVIVFQTAREIVQFSFIVRNSISYLDLEECPDQMAPGKIFIPAYRDFSSELSGHFVNTEEKFRKLFYSRRRLFYTLNLDLPTGRETSLREFQNPLSFDAYSSIPHISGAVINRGVEIQMLNDFIDECTNVSTYISKLKILKWILKFPSSPEPLLRLLNPQTANKFIDCFYPEITDSALLRDFILQFNIKRFITEHERPAELECLLYHAHLYGSKNLEEGTNPIEDYIGFCLYLNFYLNMKPLLKLVNSFKLRPRDCVLLKNKIRLWRIRWNETPLQMPTRYRSEDRFTYMLQIIWFHCDSKSRGQTEATSEVLRLIWRSVPDAYITYEEFKTVFEACFSEEEVRDFHDFYVKAIGEYHEHVEPRSLQHQCRTFIRRSLRKNNVWIPEGVARLSLPKSLKLYLNLEK